MLIPDTPLLLDTITLTFNLPFDKGYCHLAQVQMEEIDKGKGQDENEAQ